MFIRLRFWAAVCAACLAFATQAFALSCLPASPQLSFSRYQESADTYYIFEGTMTALQAVPENSTLGRTARPTVFYSFTGRALGPNGISAELKTFNVAVTPECSGPWCGAYPTGGNNIYFLRYDGNYAYSPTACPGSELPASQSTRQALTSCYGGNCETAGFSNPIPTPSFGGVSSPPVLQPLPTPGYGNVINSTGSTPTTQGNTSNSSQPFACGKELLNSLIGLRGSDLPSLFLNNPKVRLIGPGQAVTMDLIPDRLNVETNARGRVSRLRCG